MVANSIISPGIFLVLSQFWTELVMVWPPFISGRERGAKFRSLPCLLCDGNCLVGKQGRAPPRTGVGRGAAQWTRVYQMCTERLPNNSSHLIVCIVLSKRSSLPVICLRNKRPLKVVNDSTLILNKWKPKCFRIMAIFYFIN